MVHIDDESCHVLGEITVTSGLGIIFKLYVAPVNTFPHGDQVKSLWEHNYGREGLQLDVKPSMLPLGMTPVGGRSGSPTKLFATQLQPATALITSAQ